MSEHRLYISPMAEKLRGIDASTAEYKMFKAIGRGSLVDETQKTPEKDEPGYLDAIAAAGRTQVLWASLIANKLPFAIVEARQAFGLAPKTLPGGKKWNAYNAITKDGFLQRYPYAASESALHQLNNTNSNEEFIGTLETIRQSHEDARTLAQFGTATNFAISLLAGMTDPINLIPQTGLVLKGASKLKLSANIAQRAAIFAATNTAQEELLYRTQPGRPGDHLESLAMAAATGALFGGVIGFLTSPTSKLTLKMGPEFKNHKPRNGGFADFGGIKNGAEKAAKGIPTQDTNRVIKKINEMLNPFEPDNVKQKAALSGFEESTETLQKMLAEEPDARASVSVLTDGADANSKLLADLQQKYKDAGQELNVTRHPGQDDFDAFTPMDKQLNELHREFNQLSGDQGSKKATSIELAENKADVVVMDGVSILSKALGYFTPSDVFDRSPFDFLQLSRRILFYDGTISKNAVKDAGYKGAISAEATLDKFSVYQTTAMREMREFYSPSKKLGFILGRDADDGIEIQTGKKIAAVLNKEPASYVDAHGVKHEIKPYFHLGDFEKHVVNIRRQQAAFELGDIDTAPSQISKDLQGAVKSLDTYFAGMLDRADDVGMLPGKRTLAAQQQLFDDAGFEVEALLKQQSDLGLDPQTKFDAGGDGPAITKTIYSSIPEEWHNKTLFDWGSKGYRVEGNQAIKAEGRRAKTFNKLWLQELTRIKPGEDPGLVRHLRQMTGEVWTVKSRKGKYWNTDHYLAPQKAIDDARAQMRAKASEAIEKKLLKAEANRDVIGAKLQKYRNFNENAGSYFPRRYKQNAIKKNRKPFTDWLIRSWHKKRGFGIDPETGKRIRINPEDRPLIDAVRNELKIGEEIRTEGDLLNIEEYKQAVDAYYEKAAGKVWEKQTQPKESHGVESPFEGRTLELDESDKAAELFLENDAERIIAGYHNVVGGKIATTTAINQWKPHLKAMGADVDKIKSSEDLLQFLDKRFDDMRELTTEIDTITGSKTIDSFDHHREKAMLRLKRRIDSLEGVPFSDNSDGANSMLAWGGNLVLNLNYLARLGSQSLSAMNDVASMTLFTEVSSVPKNVKYLAKALLPLKQAEKRDLQLMRLAFEAEHARAVSINDIDFNDPAQGVGFGKTRKVTAAIGVGVEQFGNTFNELTLINSWNRYIKRASAMISMDRLMTNSKRLLKVQALVENSGMEINAAIKKAGMSRFDYGRMKEYGINAPQAREILDLVRRYGSDENGKTFTHLSPDEMLDYKGLMLPDAGRWLKNEGDSARKIYDTYVTAINTEVERAMILTPGQLDRPLMNDHWWGRMFNQFQSFGFAWVNQVVKPMAQRPAGKQMATVLSYFATGAFVDAIRNDLSQRRTIDETIKLWQENPWGMTYSIAHTAGAFGPMGRLLALSDQMGFGPGTKIAEAAGQPIRYPETTLGSLAPALDWVELASQGVQGISQNGISVGNLHKFRKMAPMQNLILFRMFARFGGIDPYRTEDLLRERRTYEPRP